ncbi:MAG: hypothetical protein KBT21_00485 [Treponema sp.]|nr:hypothetical protein [Candidatus Treponema merdequi]
MGKNEVDVIKHLLQVEAQAAALVNDAQSESSSKISQAKVKADEMFKSRFSEIVKSLDSDCQSKIRTFDENHSASIQNFKNQITQSKKDTLSFNSFLDKALFK